MRLPGKDVATPEVFPFGTPYLNIYNSLQRKDEDFFRRNNLLGLVARNASIKMAPQRFQEVPGPEVARFDVVLCFESRVFYMVVEGTPRPKAIAPGAATAQTKRLKSLIGFFFCRARARRFFRDCLPPPNPSPR